MAYQRLQINPAGVETPASADRALPAFAPARASRVLWGLMLLCAFALAYAAFAAPAYAVVLDAPTKVADDITRLHVDKRDADTHEPVIGAKMAIVDEEGNTVAEWVSDGSTFKIEKGLDVDVVYTLKEIEAPEGYSTISPISFTVDPIEGNGIIINSGDESQYDLRMEFSSLQEGVQNKLNLYDKANDVEVVTEQVVTRGAPSESSSTGTTKQVAPKTGDETPLATVMALVGAALAGIVILEFFKRRLGDETDGD